MTFNEETLKLSKEITQAISISGRENRMSKLLQKYYKKYTDEIIFDNLGSVYAVKRSKKENAKKVMISANMDEFGFIVKGITDNGLLEILELGKLDEKIMLSQRIRLINSKNQEFSGSIVTKKEIDNNSKQFKVEDMLVDIGATSREEINDMSINLGDSIVLDGEFIVLNSGERIMSKAWSNRYGCILGIELLEELKDIELDVDLFIGATVQHEVGLRGAETATQLIKPDLGIILECLEANDLTEKKDAVGKLGEGVLVNYYDKSMMPNRELLNCLVETCKQSDIDFQYYYSMKESDAKWVHKLLIGCPTLIIGICARNFNTNNTIIDTNDYLSAKKSAVNIIKSLNTERINEFKSENR